MCMKAARIMNPRKAPPATPTLFPRTTRLSGDNIRLIAKAIEVSRYALNLLFSTDGTWFISNEGSYPVRCHERAYLGRHAVPITPMHGRGIEFRLKTKNREKISQG
jgi:hypothetical protein